MTRQITYGCKLCGETREARRCAPELPLTDCPKGKAGRHVWAEETDDLV